MLLGPHEGYVYVGRQDGHTLSACSLRMGSADVERLRAEVVRIICLG
jgi:hypothetical protein